MKPVFTVHCSAPGMRNAVIRSEKPGLHGGLTAYDQIQAVGFAWAGSGRPRTMGVSA